ncbi:MAG: UDP-glucose/GDP-mannose dehydrogenase family protein [Deltaproteobacteria bacterium]|nr:UDP-glucose/GDP-mannose dehydrogenase family protein [Deltaproteobacteria bacterium]
MKIAIIGTGYVGLVAGAGLSDFGNDVVCVDLDAPKVAALDAGRLPIYEPGLDALVSTNKTAGRLSFSTDLAASVRTAEIVFIAVGTPSAADGSVDLSAFWAATESIGTHMKDGAIVATKSTVPVGTADKLRKVLAAKRAGLVRVASNPEFLKEGDAVNDFMKPDRIIIGVDDDHTRTTLRSLYAPFVRTNDRILTMDPRSAELTKYAANAMLATRISFMNDLAALAEKIGGDIDAIRRGLGSDHRIGNKFLFAGPGYGGSCFPKDVAALLHLGKEHQHELPIVRAAQAVNERQKRVVFAKIERHFGGELTAKRVALWGLAFKAQTDDVRESPALSLVDDLLRAGAEVHAYDPEAMPNVSRIYAGRIIVHDNMYAAVEGADALALMTEWHAFRRPDFARMKQLMRGPLLFDGRNVWDPGELTQLGFRYHGIGRRVP